MKTMKKLFFSMSLILMMLFAMGVTSNAATVTVQLTHPTRDYDTAQSFFELLNEKRAEKGQDPYILDSGLMEVAMMRAEDCTIAFTHDAINDKNRTGYVVYLNKMSTSSGSSGENIAWVRGTSVAQWAYEVWASSSGHYMNLHGNYKYCGIGVVDGVSGRYWVLVVSTKRVGDETASVSGTKKTNRTVEVDTRFLEKVSDENIDLNQGETTPYFNFMNAAADNAGTNTYGYPVEDGCVGITFSSSDTKVFTVNQRGCVTARGAGSAILTVKVNGGKTFNIPVTVMEEGVKAAYAFELEKKVYDYTGSAIEPKMIGKMGSRLLTEGKEYTVSYENNVAPGYGKAKWTLKAAGGYTWHSTITFLIRQNLSVSLDKTIVNDGEKPVPIVKDAFGKTLKGVYSRTGTVAFKNNFAGTDADYYYNYTGDHEGPAKHTVRIFANKPAYIQTQGMSKIAELEYTVKPASGNTTSKANTANKTNTVNKTNSSTAANNGASAAANKTLGVKLSFTSGTYTGKVLKPKVTVTANGKKLAAKNYTVTYKNNKAVGTATVTVNGKDDYKGYTGKGSFTITPSKTSIKNPTAKKAALIVKWKKNKSAQSYQIQVSANKNFKNAKTISAGKGTSYTVKGLQRKTRYYVRVRAITKSGKTTLAGPWSSVKSKKTK